MVVAVFMHQLERSVPLNRLPEKHYQLTESNRGLQLLLNRDAGIPRTDRATPRRERHAMT
jgi:hypothetical protein